MRTLKEVRCKQGSTSEWDSQQMSLCSTDPLLTKTGQQTKRRRGLIKASQTVQVGRQMGWWLGGEVPSEGVGSIASRGAVWPRSEKKQCSPEQAWPWVEDIHQTGWDKTVCLAVMSLLWMHRPNGAQAHIRLAVRVCNSRQPGLSRKFAKAWGHRAVDTQSCEAQLNPPKTTWSCRDVLKSSGFTKSLDASSSSVVVANPAVTALKTWLRVPRKDPCAKWVGKIEEKTLNCHFRPWSSRQLWKLSWENEVAQLLGFLLRHLKSSLKWSWENDLRHPAPC